MLIIGILTLLLMFPLQAIAVAAVLGTSAVADSAEKREGLKRLRERQRLQRIKEKWGGLGFQEHPVRVIGWYLLIGIPTILVLYRAATGEG